MSHLPSFYPKKLIGSRPLKLTVMSVQSEMHLAPPIELLLRYKGHLLSGLGFPLRLSGRGGYRVLRESAVGGGAFPRGVSPRQRPQKS